MVNISINGKKIKVKEELTVLEAAEQAGIYIPTLCHVEGLPAFGACRLCLVEVELKDEIKIVPSCLEPVEEGKIVKTDTEEIKFLRKGIIELLLARAPETKRMKELAREMGVKKPRFYLEDKDCILCGLCIRICEDIVGVSAISLVNRGADREVATPFYEISEDCIGCGACSHICPTDAIKMELGAAEKFRTLPGMDRLCRYSLMGIMPYSLCANSFRCYKCEIDQRFRDQLDVHPIFAAKNIEIEPVKKYFNFLKQIRENEEKR